MSELRTTLGNVEMSGGRAKADVYADVKVRVIDAGYLIAEENTDKPWGAYLRLDSSQAGQFIADFFPHLTEDQIRLGIKGAELSPKLLLVAPAQRLSLQYHRRRAEIWRFLTEGAYVKSLDDNPGEAIDAKKDEVVQFVAQARHRLIGSQAAYTLVAEIWQHTDAEAPSDEDDIVRLDDDYAREVRV